MKQTVAIYIIFCLILLYIYYKYVEFCKDEKKKQTLAMQNYYKAESENSIMIIELKKKLETKSTPVKKKETKPKAKKS